MSYPYLSQWALLAQESGADVAGEAVEKVAETATTSPGTLLLMFALLVFVVPLVLGPVIAKMLKLKDVSGRISLVLFALFMGLTPMLFQMTRGNSWKESFNLGIDLAGGTNLVYQLDREEAARLDKEINSQLIQQMVGAIIRRINPSGTEEVTVRQVGADRIEVIIPGDDPELVQQKKNAMTRLGSLEFAIVANQKDHARIIAAAQDVEDDLREDGRVIASWKKVAGERIESGEGRLATRPILEDGKEVGQEVLVIVEPNEDRRITGRYLTRAQQVTDESGAPAVGFTFNQRGGFLFQALTSENRPDAEGFYTHLAILLDNQVHSAPRIQTTISDQGQISGRFSQQEIDELINVLNAGALEVPFTKNPVTNKPEPISENTISPLLGVDVQQKGIFAITVSGAAVFFFMLIYYRAAGVIACICLLMNLVLILGTMALISATITLPGLAGLVLTIGMAVDANVLIYERMREEQMRGASLRMTIQNGFGKALSAIIDSNITTLITAVILYLIGTDQIRGFAVVLFIGIVMTLFSVLVVGRLFFEIAERKRWIKQLKMSSIVGETHIDFLRKQKIFIGLSVLLVIAGFAGLGARGQDNLDIDFSGGTMVTFEFENPHEFEQVRQHLFENIEAKNISLERLEIEGEVTGAQSLERYRMRTTEQNVELVRQQVVDAFEGSDFQLRRVTIDFSDPEPVTTENAPEGFAGGYRTIIDASSPVKIVTLTDQLAQAVERLAETEGGTDYGDPTTLFTMLGMEEGAPATIGAGSATAAFDEVQVTTTKDISEADFEKALKLMQADMAATPLFDEVNSFASSVADEMKESAVLAMIASGLAVVAYLWFRFSRATFGIAAIVAVFHDVFIVMGMIALGSYLGATAFGQMLGFTDFKFNMTIVAALMTIIGYSLNDTIVIFDRIREVRGKNPALTSEMINLSVNQTLSRTILTSVTTTLVVIILYAFGGEGIHGFAYAMLIGMIAGTYSTVFIANPILIWLTNRPGSATAAAAKVHQKEMSPNARVAT